MQTINPTFIPEAAETAHAREVREASAKELKGQSFINNWCEILRKVNYGLLGKSVPVQSRVHLPAPALTTGTEIMISTNEVMRMWRKSKREAVMSLLGLDYHEVSHLLFSPAAEGSPLSTRIKTRAKQRDTHYSRLFSLCNIFEDARIEALFIKRYPAAAPYFARLVAEHIVEDTRAGMTRYPDRPSGKIAGDFLLTFARLHVPREIRAGYEAEIIEAYDQRFVDEVKSLYARYAREDLLASSAAQKRAGDVIAELYDLVVSYTNGYVPEPDSGHNQDVGAGDKDKNEFDPDQKPGKDSEEVADSFEDEAEAMSGESGDEDGEGDESATGPGEDAEDGEGEESEGDGGNPAGPADSGDESDNAGEAGGEENTGTGDVEADPSDAPQPTNGEDSSGVSANDTSAIDHLVNQLENLMDDIEADQTVNDKVDEIIDSLNDMADADSGEVDWGDGYDMVQRRLKGEGYNPGRSNGGPEVTIAAAQNSADVLRRLKADAGAYWERRTDAGPRLNPVAYKQRNPWDFDIWDRHEEGQEDEFDIETYVLLDASGSMRQNLQTAGDALWAIRYAFDAIDARTTCVAFGDGSVGMYKSTDPIEDTPPVAPFTLGGTNPLQALKEARQKLTGPDKAATRYCLIITDGVWALDGECNAIVDAMNADGVVTVLVYINNGDSYWGSTDLSDPRSRHYCKLATEISPDDITALPSMMESIVRHRVASAR